MHAAQSKNPEPWPSHVSPAIFAAARTGAGVGIRVGMPDGVVLGAEVGTDVGTYVGAEVGVEVVGTDVGTEVGADVGTEVGVAVGTEVGTEVGVAVGTEVGTEVGAKVGTEVGTDVGTEVGAEVGTYVGLLSPTAEWKRRSSARAWSSNMCPRRGVVANKKNRNGIGSKRLFFRLEDYGVDQHINGHHGGAIILYPEKAQLLVPDQLNSASPPLSPSRRLSSVSGFTKHFPRPEPDSKYFWAIGDIKQLVVTKAKVAITGARAKEVANFQGKGGSARVVTTIVFDNPGVAEDWATEIRREMRQSQLLKRYADGDEEAGKELKRRRSEQDLANSEAMAQITGVPSPRTAAAVSARLQRIALSRTTSTTSSSSSSTAAPASAAAAAAAQDANAVSSSMVATVAQLKSELYDASLPQMLHCMVPRGADNGDQHWWYVDSIERDHFKEAIGAMVHAGIGNTTEAIRHLWSAIGRAGGVENGGGSGGGEGATHIDLQSIVSALSVICSASEHGTITDIVWCAFEKGGADEDQLSMAQIKRYLHTIIVMKVCVCV